MTRENICYWTWWIGENSKIVLLGDIDQIDTPYIDSLSNGLTIVAEKFKNEYIAGHIQLKKGERSYLSAVAAKILWVKYGQNIYI